MRLIEDFSPHVDAGHIIESVQDLEEGRFDTDRTLLVALGHVIMNLEIVDQGSIEMCERVAARLIGDNSTRICTNYCQSEMLTDTASFQQPGYMFHSKRTIMVSYQC